MDEKTKLIERIKEWMAHVVFVLFLKLTNRTEDQFIDEIVWSHMGEPKFSSTVKRLASDD